MNTVKKESKDQNDKKSQIKPLGDRIVVKPLLDEGGVTASGIIIPDTISKERPERGVVISVGAGKWNEAGDKRLASEVVVGDIVLFSKYGPDEIKVDDQEFFILREDSILAIIK